MSLRTTTRPPDDQKMWRLLIARTHPDAGGDHDLFIWSGALKEVVCGGELHIEPKPHPPPPPTPSPPPPVRPPDDKPRVAFGEGDDFEEGRK